MHNVTLNVTRRRDKTVVIFGSYHKLIAYIFLLHPNNRRNRPREARSNTSSHNFNTMLRLLGKTALQAASASGISPFEGLKALAACASRMQIRTAMWSVEREPQEYKDVNEIINDSLIVKTLEESKEAAKDIGKIRAILEAAKERCFLKDREPGPSEFVQGLTYEEAATLINVDSSNETIMQEIFDTAYDIKQKIYGNRIVLFSPLYLANHCVNNCRYCAFRSPNKHIERSDLTTEALKEEVIALQKQGHRRLLVLTGEHPRYSFDRFLEAIETIASVKSDPCGNIRRMNVEIPAISLSDMRRLKATDKIGTYTLFQETYHRPTFKYMHIAGPKSDYDNRVLVMDRAMRAGLDDVGLGVLYGLYDYKYEVMGLLMHANHLEKEYKAGPHTISVPRMRPADASEVSLAPPYPVDDADFKKIVAVLRIAVPYTGMILSTRESPEMRKELLKLGMSQVSAGSKTDVGSYHRDTSKTTEEELGDVNGQFTLADHRPVNEIVIDLMKEGYVPSWCTACYRKGRTGEHFMKIAKAGNIHNFCHPNSLLTLQEYINDYGTEEEKKLGAEVIERELGTGLSEGAQRLTKKKLAKVNAGEHDQYI
jgi:2-iminoacetate synthase